MMANVLKSIDLAPHNGEVLGWREGWSRPTWCRSVWVSGTGRWFERSDLGSATEGSIEPTHWIDWKEIIK